MFSDFFLLRNFKQEHIFYVLQDHQCTGVTLWLEEAYGSKSIQTWKKAMKESDFSNMMEFKIQICICLDLTDYARFFGRQGSLD
jgi:hypothetical protein